MMNRLADILEGHNAEMLHKNKTGAIEIRIRKARPLQLVLRNGVRIMGESVEPQKMERIISMLMDDSLYSRERELRQGYFTTAEGCRVGVCGKTASGEGGIACFADIGSLCIRIPREVHGCGEKIMTLIERDGLMNLLVLSSPGLGKTTLLRELARRLSQNGYNVAIADERREIAVCMDGIPSMNVGDSSDVMDACPKAVAIPLLVRACAPDVLITDEIGSAQDAEVLLDAVRCGVHIIASAHGNSFSDVCKRVNIARALNHGAFDAYVLLGPAPGMIRSIGKCKNEVIDHVEGDSFVGSAAQLRGDGACVIEYAQKASGCDQ